MNETKSPDSDHKRDSESPGEDGAREPRGHEGRSDTGRSGKSQPDGSDERKSASQPDRDRGAKTDAPRQGPESSGARGANDPRGHEGRGDVGRSDKSGPDGSGERRPVGPNPETKGAPRETGRSPEATGPRDDSGQQRRPGGDFQAGPKEKPLNQCSPEVQKRVRDGVNEAGKLAGKAVDALDRKAAWQETIKKNFPGATDKQLAVIKERFTTIRDTIDRKTITCAPELKDKKGGVVCADSGVGTRIRVNEKEFTRDKSDGRYCPPGDTMVHEGAHNAGAMEHDNKKGPDNNALNYENFVKDLRKAGKDFAPEGQMDRKPDAVIK